MSRQIQPSRWLEGGAELWVSTSKPSRFVALGQMERHTVFDVSRHQAVEMTRLGSQQS